MGINTMENDLYKNYVYDLCTLVKMKAREAKFEKDKSVNTDDEKYQLGHLMAFYEVVSLMKQQADAFEIDPKLLGLEDLDPDLDLL